MLAYRKNPQPTQGKAGQLADVPEPAEISAPSAMAETVGISTISPERAQPLALFQSARSRDLSTRLREDVKFRCTFDEKQLFDRLARGEGVSLSDFARSALGFMAILVAALASAPKAKREAFEQAFRVLTERE